MSGNNGKRSAAGGTLLGEGLDDLVRALRRSKKAVAVATPFMSFEVADLMVRSTDEGRANKRRLIVAVNVAAVEGGYLDPDAVEAFVDRGWDIRSLRNLHAKVVLVDDRWGLVGSGNLTRAGQNGGNAELGVVLGPTQASNARLHFFDRWWRFSEPLDLGHLRTLRRKKPRGSMTRHQRAGQGGLYRPEIQIDLATYRSNARDSGYWLKILYENVNRETASDWHGDLWVSDRHVVRNGKVIRRPAYRIGDHLVIYVAGGRHACPAVVRVTREPAYDPKRVAREADAQSAEKWGWVTDVSGVTAVELAKAPTLSDIGVRATSVRQHGHIRLTSVQYHKALRAIRGS